LIPLPADFGVGGAARSKIRGSIPIDLSVAAKQNLSGDIHSPFYPALNKS
jgi:hypothetical protein